MASDRTRRFRTAYWHALRELDCVRLRQWEHSRLTLPQLRILYEVRSTPGVTVAELSRRLGITVSTTSGLVIKLVEHALIERSCGQTDRRQAPLVLSAEGDALLGGLTDLGRPFLLGVAAELGDELDEVTAVLDRLAAATERVRRVHEQAHGDRSAGLRTVPR